MHEHLYHNTKNPWNAGIILHIDRGGGRAHAQWSFRVHCALVGIGIDAIMDYHNNQNLVIMFDVGAEVTQSLGERKYLKHKECMKYWYSLHTGVGDFSLGEFQFKIFPSDLTFGQFQFGIFPHLSLSGKIISAEIFQKFLEFCSDYISPFQTLFVL